MVCGGLRRSFVVSFRLVNYYVVWGRRFQFDFGAQDDFASSETAVLELLYILDGLGRFP